MIRRELEWRSQAEGNVRVAEFVRRSSLGIGLAAAVANAIGERTRELLDTSARVEILPPIVLDDGMWSILCDDARVYAVRGERLDAALSIGMRDAHRIALQAFGETGGTSGLSPLEAQVLDRFVSELIPAFAPICGRAQLTTQSEIRAPKDYVEILFGAPLDVRLGIGVSEPPAPTVGRRISPEALEHCPLECSVQLGAATVDIFTIARLQIGDVLRLEAKVGPSATLNLGSKPIAAGEGGVLGNRAAFMVHDLSI